MNPGAIRRGRCDRATVAGFIARGALVQTENQANKEPSR
jgi:hypothetical protein